jgi:hypothetical protein
LDFLFLIAAAAEVKGENLVFGKEMLEQSGNNMSATTG